MANMISNANHYQMLRQAHIELKKLQIRIEASFKWKIFPFVIKLGAIGNSETGYKPLYSKISDFGKFELILTGDSPVMIDWKNASKLYQKNKGITDPITHETTGQDQFYTKRSQVGDYWEAYLVDDTSGVSFGNLPYKQSFTTLSTARQYTLLVTNEYFKINDYLQYFVVFNNDESNLAGDTTQGQDRQVLFLSGVKNYYSPLTGAVMVQSLTFSSLNDHRQASGKSLDGYIQYASPGSGYAFPSINKGVVSLNETLLRNIGVRYAHRQAYGIELLSSISYFGRPIIQGERPEKIIIKSEQGQEQVVYEQKVFASRRLFIAGNNELSSTVITNNGGLFAGINDTITTNSHPETTFYNLMDVKPTGYANYNSWQDFLKNNQFNFLTQKSFKGIVEFDKAKAINSNGSDLGNAKFFWDSLWTINNLSGVYNVEMSSNFKYKQPSTNKIIGNASINYSNIVQKTMSAVINFNSVVFTSLLQMPYDFKQWLPFSLSSVPLIGKLLNVLTLGIPVGFVINQSSEGYQRISFFNGFISAFFANSIDNIFGKNGLIPLNAFSNNSDFELGQMLGANVSTTALTMKLSDRISIYPWDPKKGKKGEKLPIREQISTVDLSQELNGKAYIMDFDTEFLDISSPLTRIDENCHWNPTPNGIIDGQNYAFIIDYIVTQSLHQGIERHTFYSDNPFSYKRDYNEISVAQFLFNNQALFTGNMFNWTTQYKLNHDEYDLNENTTFNYPASILPPDPIDILKKVVININLVTKLNYSDVSLWQFGKKMIYIDKWLNENKPSLANIDIDISLSLNQKLKIKNFQDLKRFYNSVTLHYSYNVSTIFGYHDANGTQYIADEFFIPAKSQNGTLTINLDDLFFSSNTPKFNIIQDYSRKKDDYGTAYVFYQCSFTKYKLLDYKFTVSEKSNITPSAEITNTNAIGIDIINLSDNFLNWKISTFITPAKVQSELLIYGKADAYSQRYTNDGTVNISQIVFNPK